MTSYRIVYSRSAEKFIRANKPTGIRFMKAFEEIANDFTMALRYDIKRYHHENSDSCFRLRIGKYRAIFRIIKDTVTVYVIDIGSRGDIYK